MYKRNTLGLIFLLAIMISFFSVKAEAQNPEPLNDGCLNFLMPGPGDDGSNYAQCDYPNMEIVTVKEEAKAKLCPDKIWHKVVLHYPQKTGHPEVDKKIRAFAMNRINESQSFREGLLDSSEEECGIVGGEGIQSEYTVVYFVSKPSPKYLSVLFHGYGRRTLGNPYWDYHGFVFDLDTGRQISNDEIFAGSEIKKLYDSKAYQVQWPELRPAGASSEAPSKLCKPDDMKWDLLCADPEAAICQINLLVQGEIVLTPEGAEATCQPGVCGALFWGQTSFQTFETEVSKDCLIKMGVSPKFWQ